MFANLKRFDSRKIALFAFIEATVVAIFSCLCVLRRSKRIWRISTRMNIAGSLKDDGMIRSGATSVELGRGGEKAFNGTDGSH